MAKLIVVSVLLVISQLVTSHPTSGRRATLTKAQIDRLRNWVDDGKHNIEEFSGQVEGDMVLSSDQRTGLIDTRYRWAGNVIPYELAPVFTEEEVAWIKESLLEYDKKTCLTVRERVAGESDYVYVTGDDSGCWSYVGRSGGRQTLNLQRSYPGNGCFRNGTIVHEFLHAAGFFHQQSAPERDDYVEIVWENIQPGTENNFNKQSPTVVTSFGEPYDYGSVMHYGAYAFSINDERTIITLDPDAEIGQRYEMSEIDANKVNLMYCP